MQNDQQSMDKVLEEHKRMEETRFDSEMWFIFTGLLL